MIYGLFGMSLNLIWGYANIPSFGHAAFFGVGAYTAAIIVLKVGITNFWLGLLLAIVATAAVAAILGVPAFRVFGVGAGAANPIYFLLATIAFGELLSRLAISSGRSPAGPPACPGSRSRTSGSAPRSLAASTTTWCS